VELALKVLFVKVRGTSPGSLRFPSVNHPSHSVAEVTIQIKNQGEEAFKPNEYGQSIIITRKFTKEGNSSWKIKSGEGKVISTKKEELSAICDHMNIQVDNPMNVLTQGELTETSWNYNEADCWDNRFCEAVLECV
jgi:chromosome segregation ATPase